MNAYPDSKVPWANMGPTWVLSAQDGPHVGPRNLAIWVYYWFDGCDGKTSTQINVKTDACSWVKNSTTTHVHHRDVLAQNSEKHHWNALVYDRKKYCENCISYLSFLYDRGSTLQMHLFVWQFDWTVKKGSIQSPVIDTIFRFDYCSH